ncbi:MAG: sterol desaturase family protein [Siculibacillus sp.]|nr:sterol desaturase family protein [Siculibacillus sp.]
MLADVATFLFAPVHRLTDLADPFSAVSLAGALVFACVLALRRQGTAPGRFGLAARVARLRAFVRAALPRRIWSHPSARLDYRLFVVTSLFYATGVVELVVTAHTVEHWTASGLDALFGPTAPTPPPLALVAAVTVCDFLVFELAYWFAHRLLHRVPALWAFHSLHHSAEVLTPFTEWRQHPVELFLFPAINAVMLGAFWGLTHHLFGADAQPVSLLGFNAIQLVAVFTVLHLRHTHLWITLPGLWAKLLQTPAHHMIHHSADPRHFDRNLGLFLSLWDWVFGTLWIPRPEEKTTLTLGLGAAGGHHGVADAWISPVIAAGRSLVPRAAPPRTPPPTGTGLPAE